MVLDESDDKLALKSVDFKGEALTFRETTNAMLSSLQHCLDAVGQREDVWRRRLEKEMERRKQLEQVCLPTKKTTSHCPDQEVLFYLCFIKGLVNQAGLEPYNITINLINTVHKIITSILAI